MCLFPFHLWLFTGVLQEIRARLRGNVETTADFTDKSGRQKRKETKTTEGSRFSIRWSAIIDSPINMGDTAL